MRSLSLYRPRQGNGEPVRDAAVALAVTILAIFVALVDPISARASMLDEGAAASPAEPESAVAVIERFHDELLVVMQHAGEWDYRDRRDRLAPSVVEIFDSGFMTRIASGRYWKTFDEDQRVSLTGAFRAFTLANYAARFNGYSGQSFRTTRETRRDEKRTFVRTKLVKSDGEAIRIDYLMHLVANKWRIIDVFVEGRFSELAVRRSEFAPLLRDQGFPGLVEVLRSKVSELEAEDRTE